MIQFLLNFNKKSTAINEVLEHGMMTSRINTDPSPKRWVTDGPFHLTDISDYIANNSNISLRPVYEKQLCSGLLVRGYK